jgi:hypothetical protein
MSAARCRSAPPIISSITFSITLSHKPKKESHP